jgi:hypothetical protein
VVCNQVTPDVINQLREDNAFMGQYWHLERATLFGRGTPDDFAVNDPARHKWAPEWAAWIASGGAEGMEPPQEIKDLHAKWQEFSQYPSDSQEAIDIGREYFSYFAEQLPIIPSVGLTPQPAVVTNRLRNVPTEDIFFASDNNFYAPFFIEQWYFEDAGA